MIIDDIKKFGLQEGINEVIGIVTESWVNTAPLGIIVESDGVRVKLYNNHTRELVRRSGELYINVIIDPIVFVVSAFEDLSEDYFESLSPPIIKGAMSWIKFKADLKGIFAHLEFIEGEILRKSVIAINRGFNALIEALIHGTRYVIKRDEKLKEMILYYGNIINKCGWSDVKKAYELMLEYLEI